MLPNRLLFYGPKGCGKTLVVNVFFGELELTPLYLKKPEILKKPFGNLKEAFDLKDRLGFRGIIIEDFDDFLIDLNEFKSARRYLIEKIKTVNKGEVIIATARQPWKIEDSILKDFDDILLFSYRPITDRQDILRVHSSVTRKIKFEKNVDLKEIAEKTVWFSGGELENLILMSLQQSKSGIVSMQDIEISIKEIKNKINIGNRIKEMELLLDFTLKYCTLKEVKEELVQYVKLLKNDIIKSKERDINNFELNKILHLKPNFFGFGLDINELIESFKRRFKKKINKK